MQERPRLDLPMTRWDWFLEAIGFLFIVGTWIVPMYFYDVIPDRIPIHFNAAGTPDGFSDRVNIWILPGVNTLLFLGMTFLTRYPHVYNYLVKINQENAEFQYRNAVFMIRYLKALVALVFLYATISVIMVALGQWQGTGIWFLPTFLVLMMGSMVFFLVRSKRHSKT